MRIKWINEASVPISRYADGSLGSSPLTTSVVSIVTDQRGNSEPLVGYGFTSIGRFAQGGLIRERFAARLLNADPPSLMHGDGRCIDPMNAWSVMMTGEKLGGHGERCVAVGALDMALWDLAAKAMAQPLHRLLATTFGRRGMSSAVPVYAGGGYYFPSEDIARLRAEAEYFRAMGLDRMKIKIGSKSVREDIERIDAVLGIVGDGSRLAIDAINAYQPKEAIEAAQAIAPYELRWFEDICDPLDFETHSAITQFYRPPISAGEAIFSLADARNLLRYGGLRAGHDVLTFDPAHCYGIPEFVRIVEMFEAAGWSRADFQPHGGHLYGLQVAAGLGLGGCECNPHNFQPFGGFSDDQIISAGTARPSDIPGIGFESRGSLMDVFRRSFSA